MVSTSSDSPPTADPVVDPPVTPVKPFEFSVRSRLVREALRALKPLVATRVTLPVLACVLVERQAGVTRFTATDLDNTLSHLIPGGEREPASALGRRILAVRHEREDGRVTLQLAPLLELLKSVDPDGEITFRHDSIGWIFRGRQISDARCLGPAPEEFPAVPPIFFPARSHDLPATTSEAIFDCLPCISEDESRYILHGVSVEPSGTVAATDGHCLLAIRAAPIGFEAPVIIPGDTIRLLRSVLATADGAAPSTALLRAADATDEEANLIRFDFGSWSLTSKLIDGTYPNWKQVIPTESKREVAFSSEALATLAESVPKLPRRNADRNDGVSLTLTGRTLRVATLDAAYVECTVVLLHPAEVKAKPVTTCLAREFLMRALRLGLNHLRLIDSLSAIVFADGVDSAAVPARRRFIAMPLRVS